MGFLKKTKENIPQPVEETKKDESEELKPLNELTPLEEAIKQEQIKHTMCLEYNEELRKNPNNDQLKVKAGYAIIDWQEAQKEVERLEREERK